MNKAIFENRAKLAGTNPASGVNCPKCDNPLVFAMQDNHHQFSLDLFTILSCLKLAEQEGGIPELPAEWWLQIEHRYHLNL